MQFEDAGRIGSTLAGRMKRLMENNERVFALAYIFTVLGLVVTSLGAGIWPVVVGHFCAAILCAFSILQKRRFLHPSSVFAALQIVLLVAAGLYLVKAFPEGRFTALVLTTSTLMIAASPTPFRLPLISHWIIGALLLWIYGSLAAGAPGLDHVLAHSKNYVGIFLLFFALLHIVEASLAARRPLWWLVLIVALANVATLSITNAVSAVALTLLVVVMGQRIDRVLALALIGLVCGSAAAIGPVRDEIVALHMIGPIWGSGPAVPIVSYEEADVHRTVVDRAESHRRAVQYLYEALTTENKLTSRTSRLHIWQDYIASIDIRSLFLGSWIYRPSDNSTLHNSILLLHAKFGIFAIVILLAYTIVILKDRIFMNLAGVCILIFTIQSLANTVAFSGTYFDFAVLAILPLAAHALHRRSHPTVQTTALSDSPARAANVDS